jgi:hypothetical protein
MQNSMEKRKCAWEVEKAQRFMVAYILCTWVANFITRKQGYKTDVQKRFLKRPISAGKGGKAPRKAPRHNFGLSNYKYIAVTAFNVQICSSM